MKLNENYLVFSMNYSCPDKGPKILGVLEPADRLVDDVFLCCVGVLTGLEEKQNLRFGGVLARE